ncbi:hypothetical protein HPB52_012450 [Rhipicephalus sanguineus]|uniref:Endonuclease/exonuclease/phosphatase domain-containing protein n=1 Tax=Rhipicephalus sanguineus TaxID=34632 RepID=A0A9D4QAW0_RHISA|nr:hypothetical protein HPB52_012450 [Rhipicephalus sanguineus]
MQGGRREQKWQELYEILDKGHIEIAGLTETHLRNDEYPPTHTGLAWEGLNRQGGDRKGGGLGFLYRLDTQWERTLQGCTEHMWMKGTLGNLELAIGLVYLWTGADSYQKNVETLGCVERDIQTIGLPTIIIGDFNAHIEDLDGKTDRMGKYLLDWADKEGLVILNTSDKCVGKTTWAVSDKQTCIDYCLVSPILFPRVVGMSIDTTGAQSVGSDHNSIWIELSSSYRPRPGVERKERHHALPEWAIDKLVETLENSVEQVDTDEYDVFEQWVVDNINSVTKTSNPATKTQKHRRKAWWDKEVSEALFKRKQACRAHRQALKHGSTGDNILQLWEAYRVAKRHMASVVQKKMRAINVRLLQNIKKAGKDSAKKFWQYIGTQQPPVPQTQASLQDPDTGQALSEEECLRLVEKHFSAKFHSMASAAEDTDPETRKSLSSSVRGRTMPTYGKTPAGQEDQGAGSRPGGRKCQLADDGSRKARFDQVRHVANPTAAGDVHTQPRHDMPPVHPGGGKHRAHRATLPSIETTGLRHFICGRYATGTTAEIAGNGAGFPGATRATAVGNGGGNEASIRTLVVCELSAG